MARIPSRTGRATPHREALRLARERARSERAPQEDTPRRLRRRNRTTERSRAALQLALPEGTRAAAHVAEWTRAAKASPAIDTLRCDARARMHRLIEHLAMMQGHRPHACTLVVVWERVREALGICRRTVATMLRRLREAGLLCVVATGRRAEYTPQKDMNEAPVYGLTVPQSLMEQVSGQEPAVEPVESSCTPPPLGVVEHLVRAGEDKFSERSRFAAGELERRRASRAAWVTMRAQRTAELWPRHATISHDEGGRLSRRAVRARLHEMAVTLQEHAPDAREATTAHVAHLIRPCALAGWTVADVQHALDWSPEGARHWQAANGMFRLDLWMRRRLALWLDEAGNPVRSFTQTQRTREAEVRAQLRADRERAEARRREAAPTIPEGARAQLRAVFEATKARRAAERHARTVPVLS